MSWPEAVTLYTGMAIAAARRASHVGGGYRLYVLAKAIDRRGTGRIRREDLRAFAYSLGVSPRQWQRWTNEARAADLFTDVQSQAGEWLLILPNAGRAAAALHCQAVGLPVTIRADALFGTGWRARMWGAYEATYNGQPITRRRLQALSDVPERTQRYRDGQAGTLRTRNYSKSDRRADHLAGELEHGRHEGTFTTPDGYIAWRLPNSYAASYATRRGKGRARKANRVIQAITASQHLDGLLPTQQPLSLDFDRAAIVTLFHRTPQKAAGTLRKLARSDRSDVLEIYTLAGQAMPGMAIWTPCTVRN